MGKTLNFEKVLISSRIEEPKIKKILLENNFKVDHRNPDLIICYGGDGTILYSERQFPQIPKLVIKHSQTSRKSDYTLKDLDTLLTKIRVGKYTIREFSKLETTINDSTLIGLNELQVRAKLPISALRFSLCVNGKQFNNLIGDGVIIATPFGSTGYYKSTGGQQFSSGIGISFNNLHNTKIDSFFVSENSIIEVEITRGPAWVLADNFDQFIELTDDDVCVITQSQSIAKFICTY